MVQKLKLSRAQLASFLNDAESIKQFEKLFSTVDDVQNTGGGDTYIDIPVISSATVDATLRRITAQLEAMATAYPGADKAWTKNELNDILTRLEALETEYPGSTKAWVKAQKFGGIVPVFTNTLTGTVPVPSPAGGVAKFLREDATWQVPAGGSFTNPMTTNGDLITQAGGVPARVGIGTNGWVLTVVAGAAAWAAPGAGSSVWTDYEVDFGATPTYSKSFDITDASVSGTSKVLVVPCGKPATGGKEDDWEWDGITFAANPGAGAFRVMASAFPGPVAGKRKISYQVA
jgi:hypothetical protein